MPVYVCFYGPTSYSGIERLFWWFCDLFSKRYIHCDFVVGNRVILADGIEGKVIETKVTTKPKVKFLLRVSEEEFWPIARKFLGEKYSWASYLYMGIPGLDDGKDRPGMVCSEHVAKTLIALANNVSACTPELAALRDELVAVRPWDKKPRQVYNYVSNHLKASA